MAWEGRSDKHRYNMIQPIHNRDQQGYCKGLATIVSIPIVLPHIFGYFVSEPLVIICSSGIESFRNSQRINDDGGAKDYLHRAGRTARYGEPGKVRGQWWYCILGGGLGLFWMDMLCFFEC